MQIARCTSQANGFSPGIPTLLAKKNKKFLPLIPEKIKFSLKNTFELMIELMMG